jgi:hypothetical protein
MFKLKLILKTFKNFLMKKCIKHEVIDEPLLYMTILAKDEADVLEDHLIFHKYMGVDGFIVTDNNSTDNSMEILKKYKKKGWIKEIIDEKDNNFNQSKWVDRMIHIAKEKYGADWVINSDADEFWFCKSKNLKLEICSSTSNIIKCDIRNVLPENESVFYKNTDLINHDVDLRKYSLSKFSIYGKGGKKIIHRTKGYKSISVGNHDAKMKYKVESLSPEIIILHYKIRSLAHFKRKMVDGGKSVERNLNFGRDIAVHWRYFYEGMKDGTIDLDIEYNKVIGKEYLDEFRAVGVFDKSDEVMHIIESLRNSAQ